MLPTIPSELLRVAVADMRKVSRRKNIMIVMSVYHESNYDNTRCAVCLAGAVMAGTLRADNAKQLTAGYYPDSIESKLYALDCIRLGDITAFLANLKISYPNIAMIDEIKELGISYIGELGKVQIKELCSDLLKAAKILEEYRL